MKHNKHPQEDEWKCNILKLPVIEATISIDKTIRVEGAHSLSDTDHAHLHHHLESLKQWRKGPLSILNIEIDTEWESWLKWERIPESVQHSLIHQNDILDVGCNNGYYMFQMLNHSPKSVIGIDPVTLYQYQFLTLQHFIQAPELSFQRIGIDDCLAKFKSQFDSIFAMGVLYHHKSPESALKIVSNCLKENGRLLLETLILPDQAPRTLIPQKTYAKMKNVVQIPSISHLITQIKNSGFKTIELLSTNRTDPIEQHPSKWSRPVSLADFLDPHNPERTIEGYPAPIRAILLCQKGYCNS